MIKMSAHNIGSVVTHIVNTAKRVSDTSRGTMKRAADRIVKEAQLNTPVDTHDLEQSIHVRKTYEDDSSRLQLQVVAGEGLEEYALRVHENYEGDIAPNGPGPGTAEKMAANPGRYIGSKFLERAVEEEREKLKARMIESVTKAIQE